MTASSQRDLMAVLAEWHTEPVPVEAEEDVEALPSAEDEVLELLRPGELLVHSQQVAAAAQELARRVESTTRKIRGLSVQAKPWDGFSQSTVDVHTEFAALADEWRTAVEFEPSLEKVVMHSAYQRIIGMGGVVVPLILAELEREPDYWFWSLAAITRDDPADGAETVEEAAAQWLSWGRDRGIID
jgi:hypothetical protein